jgi:eukaryotic-like serine/threonine-protein kinase
MTNEWRRVRELFEQALDDQPASISAWLERMAAGDDQAVRDEVASLFAHNSRMGRFLSDPVTDRLSGLFAADEALTPGQTLGSYTVVREVGRGGMGRVYLATDARLGRQVALKSLAPQLVSDPSQRERLRREARAAAALAHPGICTVYALEELDDHLFIVTEFVEGRTLREEIAGGRHPSAQEVLGTGIELAAALAAAHARGITHRDLKPENVMRTTEGRLKILDFGLAHVQVAASESLAVRVTQPGMLLGTPGYMAPEQLNGQPADARADVFAFGVLLYEYACGTHPFEAATPLGIAARVLESDARPLEARCPDLPPGVTAIIERCLRKSPDDRYASAGELVRALEDVRASVSRGTSRSGSSVSSNAELAVGTDGSAARWWRTHQVVIIGLYVLAVTAAWQIKEWRRGIPTYVFVTMGIAATVAGVFRGHLLFTERVNRPHLNGERRRADPVTGIVDVVIALALGVDGLMLVGDEPLTSVLVLALAVGIVLARFVVERATSAAAFGE